MDSVSDEVFRQAVLEWLELSKTNPHIIANAGDQVPPNALEHRIIMMKELVENYEIN